MRMVTSTTVIDKSFAALTLQDAKRAHPHCPSAPSTVLDCSVPVRTRMPLNRRQNDIIQMKRGMYTFLERE